MKIIACFDCNAHIEAGTKKEIIEKILNHYRASHPDMMRPENQEKMQAWLAEYERHWKDIPDD